MTNNMSFADARKAIMDVDRLLNDPDLCSAILKIENAIDRADDAARTPGQIAFVAMVGEPWESISEDHQEAWESAARAVIAHHEQQQAEDAPADTAPLWSPVVGGWAEHREHGRVLVLDFIDEDQIPQFRIYRRGGCVVEWVAPGSLSAPVPRVWESAEDVPAHVVVRDSAGVEWAGADLIADDAVGIGHPLAPFTELLPVGGVW